MVEWDNTWSFELVNQAFGRVQRASELSASWPDSHVHAMAGANQTPADATASASLAEKTLRTFPGCIPGGH
jgi:hypothetical protein